jgi:hypothetical protein
MNEPICSNRLLLRRLTPADRADIVEMHEAGRSLDR